MTSKAKGCFKHANTLSEYLSMRTTVRENGCHEWTKQVDNDGYGRASGGKWYRIHKKSGAHQLSYICHCGTIPDGMLVCHTCDNPTCINPEHLFLGTPQVNMTDKVLKKRQTTKLVAEQVIELRKRYATGTVTQKELSLDYGVHEETIRWAINRKTWRHI